MDDSLFPGLPDEFVFPTGTLARCNRNCNGTFPLPHPIRGVCENSKAYRLQDMSFSHCGHLDCHWVFLADNPNLEVK